MSRFGAFREKGKREKGKGKASLARVMDLGRETVAFGEGRCFGLRNEDSGSAVLGKARRVTGMVRW